MESLDPLYHPPTSTITVHSDTYPFISAEKYRGTLKKKVVLITGAGRGIGRAVALAFAAAGADVACLSRTPSDLDALVEEIQQKHQTRAIAIAEDVVDTALVERAVKRAEETLGPIDILINNAGISRFSDLAHEKDLSMAWKVVEVNMLGTMNLVRAVLPSMTARKSGIIINVVSILGTLPLPYFSAYSAAKAGIIQYTKVIHKELSLNGINTYAVHPCMSQDTTIAVGAVNHDTMEKVEGAGEFLHKFLASQKDKLDLPADTFVTLCVEERAKRLSGKFVDATYDLEEVLKRAEAEDGDI